MTKQNRSNACTKPEGKMLEEILNNTSLFFERFSCAFLAKHSGVPYVTVCSQKSRLKISQEHATLYCKIPEVKRAGFKREKLRPDVQVWFDAK